MEIDCLVLSMWRIRVHLYKINCFQYFMHCAHGCYFGEREREFVCIHGYFLFLILLTFVELWHMMLYQVEASFHPSRIFPYVILSQFLQHWLFFSNIETYITFFHNLFDSVSCDWSVCGHHKQADLGDDFSFHLLLDAWYDFFYIWFLKDWN